MYLQRYRATSSTVLRIEAGALTLRAAFSHIPFWRAASSAVQRVVLAPAAQPGTPGAQQAACDSPPAGGLPRPPSTDSAEEAAELFAGSAGSEDAARGPGCSAAAPEAAAPFRPSSLQIHVNAQQATAVLCNDKPETFGAPDVLQCSLAGVVLAYDTAALMPDRPPNKAGALAHGHDGQVQCRPSQPGPASLVAHRQPGTSPAAPLRGRLPGRPCRPPPPPPPTHTHTPPAGRRPHAGRLSLKSYASFLNSSTSRWEALYDSWPLTAEFVDIVSPIYLSDRQT